MSTEDRRQRLLEESAEVPPVEEKLVRIDGTTVDVEVTAIPLVYQGKPAVQFVVRDITARKRAEQERNQETKDEIRSNE